MKLVLDWDGTCTVRDSLVAAVRAFGDPRVYDVQFASYGEALAAEVATIRVSAEQASVWAREHVELRSGFHELLARYDPVIVSSGLPQLIVPVLDREQVAPELRCNDAEPRPDGWRLLFRDAGVCPVCGDRCKRRSLPDAAGIVYVGDGNSDRCASLAADRVFARDGLARYLADQGVPFERFDTLDDVAAALT